MLDDAERAEVGTLHAQDSAFVAKQRGAAIVARNIARIIEQHCEGKPRDWAPLVYCWRGGKRSGSLAHVLQQIGWRAMQLDGGYQTYRRHVVDAARGAADALPLRRRLRPDRLRQEPLLTALAADGAQALDLEALASHRGSLLGDLPDDPQPSQKWFETQRARGARAPRSGAARVRRVGKPEDRQRAGARRAARRDARRRRAYAWPRRRRCASRC